MKTEDLTKDELLQAMDDLDKTRRALDERELEVSRREHEVDTKLEAAVDRADSTVRLREEFNLEVQQLKQELFDAQEAGREAFLKGQASQAPLVESIRKDARAAIESVKKRIEELEEAVATEKSSYQAVAGRLNASAERVNLLTRQLAERDRWNSKIMDEREVLIGKLSAAERTNMTLRQSAQVMDRSISDLQSRLAAKVRESEKSKPIKMPRM
jgi:hypothetical protein